MTAAPILEVRNLRKHFVSRAHAFGRARVVHAVDDVSFSIEKGETLALVGESGSGKSTVGRAILRLFPLTAGEVFFDGTRVDNLSPSTLRPLRQRVQVVFQDPFSSLNPRMRVGDIVAEPIRNFGLARNNGEIAERTAGWLRKVRLPPNIHDRKPHEFSGGQRQRIAIARALSAEPALIICDEAVSALDVSIKAQIVNLLLDIQHELGLALMFISHDLAVVEHLAHRVAVMYLGKIVELAPTRRLFAAPQHPYTEALLSAAPSTEPAAARQRIILKGDLPSATAPPPGCRFHTRCPYAFDRCRREEPVLRVLESGHAAACHLHDGPAAQNPVRSYAD